MMVSKRGSLFRKVDRRRVRRDPVWMLCDEIRSRLDEPKWKAKTKILLFMHFFVFQICLHLGEPWWKASDIERAASTLARRAYELSGLT